MWKLMTSKTRSEQFFKKTKCSWITEIRMAGYHANKTHTAESRRNSTWSRNSLATSSPCNTWSKEHFWVLPPLLQFIVVRIWYGMSFSCHWSKQLHVVPLSFSVCQFQCCNPTLEKVFSAPLLPPLVNGARYPKPYSSFPPLHEDEVAVCSWHIFMTYLGLLWTIT